MSALVDRDGAAAAAAAGAASRPAGPGPAGLAVARLDEREFAGMGARWNALLARSRSGTPFLTWEWLHAWWACFGGSKSLLLLSACDADGTLVGLAPLCVVRMRLCGLVPVRAVRFMGVERVSSDYLDFIAARGVEAAAAAAFVAYLTAHAGLWDMVMLSDVRETSPSLAAVREAAARGRLPLTETTAEVCPYLALPGSREAYRAAQSRGMRYHIGRRTRALSRIGTVELRRCESERDVEASLDQLFRLHRARWLLRRRAGNFGDERVRRFHRIVAPAFLRNGWLRFRVLALDGAPVAALYGFEYAGTYYYYQSGFDPAVARLSPGAVLMGLCIEEAIASGLAEFDYLRGDEPYKRKWTRTARRTVTLRLYRRRGTAVAAALGAFVKRRLKRGLRAGLAAARRMARGGGARRATP